MERILAEALTSATYKFAVLRAIVDAVIEAPKCEPRNGFHRLPVIDLARRVLAYYWKPYKLEIAQAEGNLALFRVIHNLLRQQSVLGGTSLDTLDGGARLLEFIPGASTLEKHLRDALLKARTTLLQYPLRHLPNVGGRRLELFHVVTSAEDGTADLFATSYDDHLARAPGAIAFKGCVNWLDMLRQERTAVVLSARAWEEIAEMRFWLSDAIKLRWLVACEQYAANGKPVRADCLTMDWPERDQVAMLQLRQLYDKVGWHKCIYSGAVLTRDVELDHLLPFSRFPVNYFWNIVPTTRKLNQQKRDKLPSLEGAIADRYRQYLDVMLQGHNGRLLAELDTTFRQYFQQEGLEPTPPQRARDMLWSLVQGTHRSLENAGIETWSPTEHAGTRPIRDDH